MSEKFYEHCLLLSTPIPGNNAGLRHNVLLRLLEASYGYDDMNEPNHRLAVIGEIDQMISEWENDDDTGVIETAREWLTDVVGTGEDDVIICLLRGWQREMEAQLEEERNEP